MKHVISAYKFAVEAEQAFESGWFVCIVSIHLWCLCSSKWR